MSLSHLCFVRRLHPVLGWLAYRMLPVRHVIASLFGFRCPKGEGEKGAAFVLLRRAVSVLEVFFPAIRSNKKKRWMRMHIIFLARHSSCLQFSNQTPLFVYVPLPRRLPCGGECPLSLSCFATCMHRPAVTAPKCAPSQEFFRPPPPLVFALRCPARLVSPTAHLPVKVLAWFGSRKLI